MKATVISLFALSLAGSVLVAETPSAPPAARSEANAHQPAVHDVTPDAAEKLLNARKDIVVLDVRTPDEFAKGHLAGAKNIDFLSSNFAQQLSQVEGKPILVHCASGNRSTRSLEILKTKNFPEIHHLTGGYQAWKAAGKPVTDK